MGRNEKRKKRHRSRSSSNDLIERNSKKSDGQRIESRRINNGRQYKDRTKNKKSNKGNYKQINKQRTQEKNRKVSVQSTSSDDSSDEDSSESNTSLSDSSSGNSSSSDDEALNQQAILKRLKTLLKMRKKLLAKIERDEKRFALGQEKRMVKEKLKTINKTIRVKHGNTNDNTNKNSSEDPRIAHLKKVKMVRIQDAKSRIKKMLKPILPILMNDTLFVRFRRDVRSMRNIIRYKHLPKTNKSAIIWTDPKGEHKLPLSELTHICVGKTRFGVLMDIEQADHANSFSLLSSNVNLHIQIKKPKVRQAWIYGLQTLQDFHQNKCELVDDLRKLSGSKGEFTCDTCRSTFHASKNCPRRYDDVPMDEEWECKKCGVKNGRRKTECRNCRALYRPGSAFVTFKSK